jgi:hypothetical protein
MQSSTIRVPATLLALLALVPTGEVPRFEPEEGARVKRTVEQSVHLELESLEMSFGGEELPEEASEGAEIVFDETGRYTIVDTFVETEDGRPRVLERRFEELTGEAEDKSNLPWGEEESSKERSSLLQGHTVRFTWDPEEESYTLAFAGEDEADADEALLEGLEEDLDLRGLLPEREVAEGDSWTVELERVRCLWDYGGDLKLETEDEEDDDEIDEVLKKNLAGEVQATFKGMRTVDGRELYVIAVEAELSTQGEVDIEQELEDGGTAKGTKGIELTMGLSGEVLWDVSSRRCGSIELEGPVRCAFTANSTIEAEQGEVAMTQVLRMEGTTRLTQRVEAVE